MPEMPPHSIPVTFRVRPEALNGLMRLWQQDREKGESDSIRAYLGELLLRCLNIVVTPEDQRSRSDREFLAEVSRELKDSVSVTTEEGQEVSFRFL